MQGKTPETVIRHLLCTAAVLQGGGNIHMSFGAAKSNMLTYPDPPLRGAIGRMALVLSNTTTVLNRSEYPSAGIKIARTRKGLRKRIHERGEGELIEGDKVRVSRSVWTGGKAGRRVGNGGKDRKVRRMRLADVVLGPLGLNEGFPVVWRRKDRLGRWREGR